MHSDYSDLGKPAKEKMLNQTVQTNEPLACVC